MAEANSYATFASAKYPAQSDVVNTAPTYGDPINVLDGTLDPGAGGTVPSANDVRFGVAVGATTGLLVVPSVDDVRAGTTFDTASTGLLDLPSVDDVRLAVSFDQATKTGNVRVPPVDQVLLGYAYDSLDSITGTVRLPPEANVLLDYLYGPSDTLTGQLGTGAGGYPAEGDVRLSIVYGDSSQFTGKLDLPDISDVRLTVSYDDGNAIGNVRVPPADQVNAGYDYDTLDSVTGTLTVSGGNPAEIDVRLGTVYGASSEFTGQLDLPNIGKVRAGVDYDSGTKTGNSVIPPEARVLIGTGYGSVGTEFTGTLDPESGTCTGYPLETEVLAGTVYGEVGELTGNRTDAQETDVRLGVQYAANGVSKSGRWNGETGDPGDASWIGE